MNRLWRRKRRNLSVVQWNVLEALSRGQTPIQTQSTLPTGFNHDSRKRESVWLVSVICLGSANINDRSMLGKRDSEMAVVVEDQNSSSLSWMERVIRLAASLCLYGRSASGLLSCYTWATWQRVFSLQWEWNTSFIFIGWITQCLVLFWHIFHEITEAYFMTLFATIKKNNNKIGFIFFILYILTYF